MIILFVSVFVKNIYSFGGYIEVLVCGALYWASSKRSRTSNLFICLCLLCPVLLFSQVSVIYFINDFASAFIVLSVIDIASEVKLSSKQRHRIYALYLYYIILFLLLMGDPARYDGGDNRYIGLLPTATVSSSVLMMILIGLIEEYKTRKRKFVVFAFCTLIIMINIFICKTRSVLFVFPYLIYAFYRVTSIKRLRILSWMITIAICISMFLVFINNADTLRLSAGEASTLTRLSLYEAEWRMIQEANYVVPAGFQACILMIQEMTSEDFSPHNSLFSYWIDWGVFWLLYLIVLYKKLKTFVLRNECVIPVCLILLFILSCALHNILLYSFIWMPMILILNNFKKA